MKIQGLDKLIYLYYYINKEKKMVKLEIIKIEENKTTLLREKTNETYEFELKFFDLKTPVKVGDIICMHKELLDSNFEEYSKSYYFGDINAVYGRKFNSTDDLESIIVQQGEDTTVLKRFFG